jgi:anti-sigma regulatory factor (Ser/Thr protein kinase)
MHEYGMPNLVGDGSMATDLDSRRTESMITVVTGEAAASSPRVLWRGTFPATRDQISAARRVTRGALVDHPKLDVDLVVILVSELTTNVVRHARSRSFTLVIACMSAGDLRVIVIDDGRGHTTPHLRPGGSNDVGGRGLRLVDRSATRWGVTREHGGRVAVWFDLAERTFREYARSLMAERAISLRRLAKVINYDQGYLSRVLNGHRPPSPQLVARAQPYPQPAPRSVQPRDDNGIY